MKLLSIVTAERIFIHIPTYYEKIVLIDYLTYQCIQAEILQECNFWM